MLAPVSKQEAFAPNMLRNLGRSRVGLRQGRSRGSVLGGKSTGEQHDLIVTLLERVYTIAAMEGPRGVYRHRLADLAGVDSYRAEVAIAELEAGGHLVAVDAETVRAGKPLRR
jgi:hypothetical protein